MTYIVIPLWVAIVVVVYVFLCFIYHLIGDFFARIIYKALKDEKKEKVEKQVKWINEVLTEEKGKELENDK